MLEGLIREFRKPSPRKQDPHHRGATGVWHSLLGAQAASAVFSFSGLGLICATVFVAAVYWVKESGDLSRGGSWWDSVEDALFVALGVPLGYAIGANPLAVYALTAINLGGLMVMWKGNRMRRASSR